ncbi:STAS domain-containing protein [Streptomyces luteogriseus]|uniref:STAS domain-containing protein n=1 Tax=Streptomyces luteogriseus TaxID=68233 RepID=UPI00369DE2B1
MPNQAGDRVTGRVERGVYVVEAVGDIDSDNGDSFAALWDEAAASGLDLTVVDLSRVDFGDSGLLNALLSGRARHLREDRAFVIAGPLSSAVVGLFSITGTQEHFTFAESLGRALK